MPEARWNDPREYGEYDRDDERPRVYNDHDRDDRDSRDSLMHDLDLAMIAEFEKSRIQERVRAGLARVRAQGQKLGRPERSVPEERLAPVRGRPIREAAKRLGVSPATAHRWLSQNSPSFPFSKPAEYGLKRSPRRGAPRLIKQMFRRVKDV